MRNFFSCCGEVEHESMRIAADRVAIDLIKMFGVISFFVWFQLSKIIHVLRIAKSLRLIFRAGRCNLRFFTLKCS